MYRQINPSNYGAIKYSVHHTVAVGFLNKEILTRYDQLCEKNKDNKIKDN